MTDSDIGWGPDVYGDAIDPNAGYPKLSWTPSLQVLRL